VISKRTNLYPIFGVEKFRRAFRNPFYSRQAKKYEGIFYLSKLLKLQPRVHLGSELRIPFARLSHCYTLMSAVIDIVEQIRPGAGPRPTRTSMINGRVDIIDGGSVYQGGWIGPTEAAYGAIPGESCTMNKVRFNRFKRPVYRPDLVADYIRSREGMRATRHIFTVENPHKCNHCQRNGIEGMALALGQRLFPLDYALADAIIAAMSGCALYEWVLSTYKGLESLEEGSDVRFWLLIRSQGLVQVYANNFIRDVGRVELMELDGSALLWAQKVDHQMTVFSLTFC
jgi:hypothetical protein